MPRSVPVHRLPRRAGMLAAGLAVCLGACAREVVTTGSIPTDVRERHPIVLASGARKLDVFINGSGSLDPRQRADLAVFAAEYRRFGETRIVMQIPVGASSDPLARHRAATLHSALAAHGVRPGQVSVTHYEIADPALAAPIRLSFRRLQAKVGTTCGLWPDDLGVSDLRASNQNDPYFNLGCATQSNVAMQVADPLDLVRGQSEDRVDTIRRSANFDKLRKGVDPSVPWRQDGQASSRSQISN